MAEAWMVRGGQQQRLIESLVRKFYDMIEMATEAIETNSPEEFERRVGDLRHRLTNQLLIKFLGGPEPSFESVTTLFDRIQTDIHQFARAPEEKAVLLHRFFLEVFKTMSSEHESTLSRLEFLDPQKIFHSPSAMAEVNISHDFD